MLAATRRLLLVVAVGLLAGCAGPTLVAPADQSSVGETHWTVAGRLALSNGRDGGSGSLTWSQRGTTGELAFIGAFGRGSWRLTTTPDQALLTTADGQLHHAPDVVTLVRQQTGWTVPVEALRYWIRGRPEPGSPASLRRGDDGALAGLVQHGWQVRFDGHVSGSADLPRKITADKDGHRVRLIVSRWSVDSPA